MCARDADHRKNRLEAARRDVYHASIFTKASAWYDNKSVAGLAS
jgi:hypothetical protein